MRNSIARSALALFAAALLLVACQSMMGTLAARHLVDRASAMPFNFTSSVRALRMRGERTTAISV